MSDETLDKLKVAFEPVAQKIGEGAQFGWEVVLRQQYIEGLLGIVFGILIIIIILIVLYKSIQIAKKDDDLIPLPLIVGIVGTVASALLMGWVYNSALKLLNPAYYAIEFFINIVK